MKRILAFFMLFAIIVGQMPSTAYAEVDREANKQIIFDYIVDVLELTPAAACGILANIRAESNFNPEAVGDGGDAYGICQWNSRRDSMVKFCETNGYGEWTNIYGQLAYLAYELENNKKSVGEFLKDVPNTAQGAYDAAYHFCYYYEIPSNRVTKGKQRGTSAVNTFWRDYYGGETAVYTILYDANGGTNAPKSQTKTEGVPTLITSGEPVRDGYALVGWALKPDAVSVDYRAGDEFTGNRDATLYAVWERVISDETPAEATEEFNGHTYELYKGAYTWTYASAFAEKKGGYLLTVDSEAEYSAVSALASELDGDFWLGAELAGGNWQWVTGEAFKDTFASSKWAQGEPSALYGPTERGKLAQRQDGKWIDLNASSLLTTGFIVEYGSWTQEAFPMYEIRVSSSLNLREGPGTSYDSLDVLYNGEIITIVDTVPGTSYDWGWGYTASGKTGWCAMKIPDYMAAVNGIDEETMLVYTLYEEGCAVAGYRGAENNLVVPAHIQSLPVLAVFEGAFSSSDAPDTIRLPASVRMVQPDSLKSGAKYIVPLGSDAHLAAAKADALYECVYPEHTLCPPDALTEILEDAFSGAANIECVNLSGTRVRYIASGAFVRMEKLKYVHLPETDLTIEENAFDLTAGVVFIVKAGSAAEKWVQASGADYICVP